MVPMNTGGTPEVASSELTKSGSLVLDRHGKYSGMLNKEGCRIGRRGSVIGVAEVGEMVEVLDHQFDNLRIIAGIIRGLRIVSYSLELDDSRFSFLWRVSIVRKHTRSAVSTYFESAALESSHKVLRLAAKNSFMEVETVRSANDFAIRECLGVVEPGGKAKSVWRFSKIQGSLEVGTHMAKPAFSTFKVLMSVLFIVRAPRYCKILR